MTRLEKIQSALIAVARANASTDQKDAEPSKHVFATARKPRKKKEILGPLPPTQEGGDRE